MKRLLIDQYAYRFQLATLFALVTLLVACTDFARKPDSIRYDIIIRNGTLVDGSGNPAYKADIGIRDGKIVALGTVKGSAAQMFDATGKHISPGFIDMMDQSSTAVLENGDAANKLLMGVTSAVAGEGGTPVSVAEIPDYFQTIERQGISMNFASYYGAGQARVAVVGESDVKATPEDIHKMQALVRQAMEAGVVGISSAAFYPPDSFLSTRELIAMGNAIAPYKGVYAAHMRDESRKLLPAIKEMITIGEETGISVEIFHIKNAFAPNWGTGARQAIDLIISARARGVDIAADQYPYIAGGTGLDATVPTWVFAEGWEKARELLADPVQREKMKADIAAPQSDRVVVATGGWENIVLANPQNDKYESLVGKNFVEIGQVLGKHPADAAWDMMLETDERPAALFFMMSEQDVQHFMRQPWVSIGSDAGAATVLGEMDELGLPHPRSYGTFPRIISKYVKQEKLFSLEEGVRKMTSLPAKRMRFEGRGEIKENYWADLVIFDLDEIEDKATWSQPFETPTGIETVIVNGVPVVEDGKHNGQRPGKVLYGPGKRMAGHRVTGPKPDLVSEQWAKLIGEYGEEHNALLILEENRTLYAFINRIYKYPLQELTDNTFAFPDYGLYGGGKIIFQTDRAGKTLAADISGIHFKKRAMAEDGETFQIQPAQPITVLRKNALAAQPSAALTSGLKPDLVEITGLDPTIKLDIRYATTNNFMNEVFYKQPRAFLQRPAAEALIRVHRTLSAQGLGLLIHDAYRPWYVTKMFYDATPESQKIFVADPNEGSIHNRGAAVDLTLYELESGQPVTMVSGYDEFSERAFPHYPGGTSRQRWYRELLRDAMEAQGFEVYEWEWWHFNYKDAEKYPVLNLRFEAL